MFVVGATVCEIAPPSLQLLHTYWIPVPLLWGDVVAIVWLEPGAHEKIWVAVYVVPSTLKLRPEGLVCTVTETGF